jgi:hypothetical protein
LPHANVPLQIAPGFVGDIWITNTFGDWSSDPRRAQATGTTSRKEMSRTQTSLNGNG